MEYTDIEIQCRDCSVYFWWSVSEQQRVADLFEQGKITELKPAVRCFDCRKKKKARYESANTN